jgi:hypothetical protein
MALSLPAALRNARQDAITTFAGAGALLRLYSGGVPASAGAALAGNTQLGELACSTPLAPAASGGVLTLGTITTDSSADASGTATFFRIYKADGTTVVAQGSVGGTLQSTTGDLQLNTTTIVVGGPIVVTSLTLTDGAP